MSLTISTKTYTEYRTNPDAIAYAGPNNTVSVKDTLELKRTFPKPTSTFAGVGRPNAKFVRTVTLADGSTADAIVSLSASIPVGMALADVKGMIADGVSFFGSQAAEDLVYDLMIKH